MGLFWVFWFRVFVSLSSRDEALVRALQDNAAWVGTAPPERTWGGGQVPEHEVLEVVHALIAFFEEALDLFSQNPSGVRAARVWVSA
jgi:hypothetical protein